MNDILAKMLAQAIKNDEQFVVLLPRQHGRSAIIEKFGVAADTVKKPTPFPERWINVYPTYIGSIEVSRADADLAAHSSRIAVLHVKPDRTVEVIEVEA